MRKHAYLVLFIFLLCSRVSVFSQISVKHNTGCAPLVQDSFTGVIGATGVLWDFGDGTSATINNAVHTYASPGSYTVLYTATTGTATTSQSLTVTVHGKPTPLFTATPPTKGCIPLPVTFHDNSAGGGGSAIVNWQWAFGDGGVNVTNAANQTYTYTVPGQFNVTIKVTDANGCDSSLTIPNLINVSPKPSIILTTSPNPAAACLPPLTVTFTSTGTISHSTTSPTLTYFWNFGTSTSTLANPPAQTYTATGTFPVKFIVTDNNNCSDSVIRNVIIQNPHAAFLTNDTVCLAATFTNTSTGGSVFSWDYGDGNTGSSNTHTYAAQGHYLVKLTVLNGSCQDDTTISVFAEQPVASFTVVPTYMCSLPKTITLSNSSSPAGGAIYHWDFNSGYTQYVFSPDTSNLINPTFTITNADTNRYTIYHFDHNNSVMLTITTPRGCKATKTLLVDSIYLPTARFMTDIYEGCVPLTVNFYDSSRSHEIITYREYDFGDGSPHSIGVTNPVHTYTNTGIYYPTLIIHNANGCLDTSYAITIKVGRPPVTNFSLTPTPICIGDTVHFTDLTPLSDSVDSWHYYGDGIPGQNTFASACYNTPNSSWPFTHATGVEDVGMVACFRGCCDSVNHPAAITVKGPLATFSAAMDCDSPMVYTFTGTISDSQNWTWDFGDGSTVASATVAPTATVDVVVHTYTATGDYSVILTGFNSTTGCSPYRDTIKIHVRNIKANFVLDTLQCVSTSHTFDAASSQGVYSFGTNGYTWLWGDASGVSITSSPTSTHGFLSSGIYTVTLIVKDQNGCADTISKKIKAYSAAASFTSQNTMCASDTVLFTNTSTADTTITSYLWSYTNGTTDTAKNSSHVFNITNSAVLKDSVYLTITTALGCSSTVKKIIIISRPNAGFNLSSIPNICAGDSVKFNKGVAYPVMTWNFGDGTILSTTNLQPWHTYTTAGTFTVSLSVSDSIGCKDSKINALVNVQNYPQAFIASPAFQTSNLCYPYQATFKDSSVNGAPAGTPRIWDLGTGQAVTSAQNVGTIYQLPGTYTVSLVEVTSFGCKDSISRSITVLGPIADFTLAPGTICKGQNITFTIKDTSDVFTWHWDFGDGKDTNAFSPVVHNFNFHPLNGTTNVTLVYWSDDSSCVQTKVYPINIHQVIADFDRNHELSVSDTAHCLGIPDHFYNQSTGADSWGWVFSDGLTSNLDSLTHQFASPGIYNIELFIKNNLTGCVDTLNKKMLIFPQLVTTATGDSICSGSSGQVNVTGGVTYNWGPPTGLSDVTIANPTANPTTSTNYSVVVADINGCKDTSFVSVYVQQPPTQTSYSTTIVIGQTASLPGDQLNPGFTYSWTPTTDLSCTNCPTPVCSSTVDIAYVEIVSDVLGCFSVQSTFTVYIEPFSSVDVPTAFTPNGDGTNDIVYVAGWGIKKLNYFKIFNRWGELVFETNDLKIGWDGTYKNVPQNTETYIYEVSVEPYVDNGKPVYKKGALKLLR